MEGENERGDNYQGTLMTPLNLRLQGHHLQLERHIQQHQMLVKLGVLAKAAQHIEHQYEEPAATAAGPAGGKLFGHLHIVVRDDYTCMEDVRKILLSPEEGDEFLHSATSSASSWTPP